MKAAICATLLFLPLLEAEICQNGGTFDGNKCICLENFYGPYCEYIIERPPPLICQNGATFDGNKCICLENFYGTYCEHVIDRPPPNICKNGGTFDQNKCICLENFYGPHCEYVIDRLPPIVQTKVNVELKIVNRNFTESLTDDTTAQFKEFVFEFKKEMRAVYSNVPGYKDVNVLSVRRGSIVVNHEVVVETAYSNVNITQDYELIVEEVKSQLNELKANNCTHLYGLCIDVIEDPIITPRPLPTEEVAI